MKRCKAFTISCLLAIGLWGCDSQNEQLFSQLDGEYEGLFYRLRPGIDFQIAEIEMTLQNGRFEGTSNQQNYPAICNGSYEMAGQEGIRFVNDCVFTADFDWTLILRGEYRINVPPENNTRLIISRNNTGGSTDIYEIWKKE